MTPTVRVSDLVVEYRSRQGLLGIGAVGVRAVDGVTFEIEAGQTLGLVGESGSGKTSTARALLGIAPITEGTVLIEGRDIRTAESQSWRDVRRSIQMVFQQPTTSSPQRRGQIPSDWNEIGWIH